MARTAIFITGDLARALFAPKESRVRGGFSATSDRVVRDSLFVFPYIDSRRYVRPTLLFPARPRAIDTVIIISHLFLNRDIYHELRENSQEKEKRLVAKARPGFGMNHFLPRESDFDNLESETHRD